MLKHIVFFKLKEVYSPDNKLELLTELRERLQVLLLEIPEIIALETGINMNNRKTAFDLSLMVDLENENSLSIYRNHPKHIEVLNYLNKIDLETAVVDYII